MNESTSQLFVDTSPTAAAKVLRQSPWFAHASDSFLDALAQRMIPVWAADGHVFVEEGSDITFFLIIESGTLARTKFHVEPELLDHVQSSIRTLDHRERTAALSQHSVTIDTIQGCGHVTGLLHNFEDGATAYATVSARGTVKVWLVPGQDFRDILLEHGEFAWQLMVAMTRELRKGRHAMQAVKKQMRRLEQTGNLGEQEQQDQSSSSIRSPMLKVLCYDAAAWVSTAFTKALEDFNQNQPPGDVHLLMNYTTERLHEKSATYAAGYDAVCTFVDDTVNADVIHTLRLVGVRMIAQRGHGLDRIDTLAARAHGVTVACVPKYSPHAVAEMAMTLLLGVNRKLTKASNRVKMANFTLDEGLMGFDLYQKPIGVLGTGDIGKILCRILVGFGVQLLCHDLVESDAVKEMGGIYLPLNEFYAQADVIFIMITLSRDTYHFINFDTLKQLKRGVILINTSRGALVDTKALLDGLRRGIIGGVGMDVYESEETYFFRDWSARHIKDPDLAALLGHHNVLLTAHQAFFTEETVDKIVHATIDNLKAFYDKQQQQQQLTDQSEDQDGSASVLPPETILSGGETSSRKDSREDGGVGFSIMDDLTNVDFTQSNEEGEVYIQEAPPADEKAIGVEEVTNHARGGRAQFSHHSPPETDPLPETQLSRDEKVVQQHAVTKQSSGMPLSFLNVFHCWCRRPDNNNKRRGDDPEITSSMATEKAWGGRGTTTTTDA